MKELRKQDPAAYDKAIEQARKASAAYTREYAVYDEEAIAAVDKFRADKKLDYQGNAPGLVDQRFVDALKANYLEKRKSGR
jgi:outer membrane receptor for monomeric catechols